MKNTLELFDPIQVIPDWKSDSNARIVKISNGRFAIVDACDYERVCRHGWAFVRIRGNEYAQCTIDGTVVRMHRFILCAKVGDRIDHWNTLGLDNRRINLRRASFNQNQWNMKKPATRSTLTHSRFKGVVRNNPPNGRTWTAKIVFRNNPIYIGSFPSEEAAALAYDERARQLFGKFALCNFK